MFVLRRIIRWSFASAALLFLRSLVHVLAAAPRPNPATHSHLASITFPLLYLGLGIVYAAAWFTTRKRSNDPRPWAVAASAIHVFLGFVIIIAIMLYGRAPVRLTALSVLPLALGLCGIYAFRGQRVTLAAQPEKPKNPVPERLEPEATPLPPIVIETLEPSVANSTMPQPDPANEPPYPNERRRTPRPPSANGRATWPRFTIDT